MAEQAFQQLQSGPACTPDGAGHCVTCSDEAIEAVVLQVEADGMALVAVGEQVDEVDVSLLEPLVTGDVVLIHGGVALAKL